MRQWAVTAPSVGWLVAGRQDETSLDEVVPVGRKRKYGDDLGSMANAIAGGWQVSSIASISSGSFPISLNTPVSGSNGFTERPDRVGNGSLPRDRRTVERPTSI